jgi:aldehyde dehydrogenase (NAD+)
LQLRPDQLYIFFGQGVNPFVIGERANLDTAVRDLIEVRMFNTGQDCMGPDAIFVHESHREAFTTRLEQRLAAFVFGSRKNPKADYSPIYYASTLELLSRYFITNADFIAHGGVIDYVRQKIEPTVMYGSLDRQPEMVEFFGPVFNVIFYDNDDALIKELSRDFYLDRAMGASVYGSDRLERFLSKRHTVSVDSTLFDIESGNSAFGGYGAMANYVRYQGRIQIEPILISQVVAKLMPEAHP